MDGSAAFDQMRVALEAKGHQTPEEEARDTVQRFWGETQDIDQTRIKFGIWFEERNPHAKEVFGKVWKMWIDRFVSKAVPEIKRRVATANGLKGALAVAASRGVLSTNPESIRNREWAHRVGRRKPAGTLTPESITQSPASIYSRAYDKREQDRKSRGVTVAKVEVDKRTGEIKALLTKLPVNLQSFATWTRDAALAWCERSEQHAGLVRIWCSYAADPRKTLGEQLTPEIVAELQR